MEYCRRPPHQKSSLEGFRDDSNDEWGENVVDNLLATWTTLPMYCGATRPVEQGDYPWDIE